MLVSVSVDGESFNQWLLSNGYGRLYDDHFSMRDEFAEIEAEAQQNSLGTMKAVKTVGYSQ